MTADKELEFGASLPEYSPDIISLIRVDCLPIIEGVRFDGGKCMIDGKADFVLLYESGYGKKLHTATFSRTFNQSFDCPAGIQEPYGSGSAVCTHVQCKLSDPRNPLLRAKLRVDASICGVKHIACVDTESSGSSFFRKRELMTVSHSAPITATHEINEELVLSRADRPVADVLWHNILLLPAQTVCDDGNMTIRSAASIRVMYESEGDTADYHVLTRSFPVTVNTTCPISSASASGNTVLTVTDSSVTPTMDNYGENRILRVRFKLRSETILTERHSETVATDMFTPNFKTETTAATVTYTEDEMGFDKTFTLEFRTPAYTDPYDSIVDSAAKVNSAAAEVIDGELRIIGSYSVSVLGTRDGQYESSDYNESFEQSFSSDLADGSAVDVRLYPTEVSAVQMSDGSIAIRTVMQARFIAEQSASATFLSTVKSEEPIPQDSEGITACYYYPSPDEQLWEIAKQYSVCPDTLLSGNESAFEPDGSISAGTRYIFIRK